MTLFVTEPEVGMLRLVLAQLRRRPGRAVALLLAILAATTGFTVLTASTETSKLTVVGKVRANHRGAYDIMVRPKGARTGPERKAGLLAGNALSGTFGGITTRQWQRIREIGGVEVAAPIAMVGTATDWHQAPVDLTDLVDRGLDDQVLRLDLTWRADRGLTNAATIGQYLVYVTKHKLLFPKGLDDTPTVATRPYSDGVAREADPCRTGDRATVYEVADDGSARPVCLAAGAAYYHSGGSYAFYSQLRPDGTFEGDTDARTAHADPSRLWVDLPVPLELLLAGVDPRQEAALVGLDDAVTLGRYLQDPEVTAPPRGGMPSIGYEHDLPVLLASRQQLDEQGLIDAVRITPDGRPLAGRSADEVRSAVARPAAATAHREINADQAYQGFATHDPFDPSTATTLSGFSTTQLTVELFQGVVRSGQPSYVEQRDGSLRPLPQPGLEPSATGEASRGGCTMDVPWLSRDTALRPQTLACTGYRAIARVAGVYDSARLRRFNDLVQAPIEGYYPPQAVGADEASRRLLGDRPLLPNGNPGNYLAPSPSLLTSLDALRQIGAPDDLISAVRVRVSGVTGFDPASRERVRLVAEQIATATGLDVDIMLGGSPGPQTIDLPAGAFGRPDLRINETWTRMGVAAAIMTAVDRKSATLFTLILVVCALFIANATGSAVRDRRRDLAVLTCLGWPRGRLAVPILVETGLLGLAAGGLGLAAARPAADLVGTRVSWLHAALAIPVALGLALLAAAVPALRAARSHPLDAIRSTAAPTHGRLLGHRGTARRGRMARLAWTNLARVPGRTALAVAALAVAVAALTLLAAVMIAFDGALVGTALGDAISVRVRGVDTAAIAATVVLATLAVADVLYLSVRERTHELAVLRATGWSAAATGRLITHEALTIGVLASVLGAGAGLAGAATLAGALPASLVAATAAAALAGPILAVAAATIPVLMQRRLPTTPLAEE